MRLSSSFPLINFEFKDEDEEGTQETSGTSAPFTLFSARFIIFLIQRKRVGTHDSVIYHFHPLQDVSDMLLLFMLQLLTSLCDDDISMSLFPSCMSLNPEEKVAV